MKLCARPPPPASDATPYGSFPGGGWGGPQIISVVGFGRSASMVVIIIMFGGFGVGAEVVRNENDKRAISPTVGLTKAQERALAGAAGKIRAGKGLTKAEQRAVDRRNEVRRQEAFIEVGRELPAALLVQIAGLDKKQLRTIGKRLGVAISGRSVDLWACLRVVFERLETIGPPDPEREIVRTYGELAAALGLTCRDPERTLKAYVARGMPGKAGRPGKQSGEFDVGVCRLWIAANVETSKQDVSAKVKDAQERIALLDLEIKESDRLEQVGRLADVDEVGRFNEQCANNARAILEAIPDEVLATLPDDISEQVRGSVYRKVEKLLDDAFEEIARQIEGDTDPTEDEADGDEPSAKTHG